MAISTLAFTLLGLVVRSPSTPLHPLEKGKGRGGEKGSWEREAKKALPLTKKTNFGKQITLALTGLSLYAWFRSSYLSLPLPSFLFLLALAAPFSNFAALRYFLGRLRGGGSSGSATQGLAPEILGIVAVLEAVLVTLASAQLPSSPAGARTCRLERQWQLMFQHRQETRIRRIQNALHCCGLRSTHDRAWPFPGGAHDVHACEHMLARRDSCLGPWERQAATLLAIATAIGAIGLLSKVNPH